MALAAQGFDRKRPAKVDRRHLRRVMDQIRIHQLDTIPIICRPQHMVPFRGSGPTTLIWLIELPIAMTSGLNPGLTRQR